MSKRRKKFITEDEPSQDMALQITSMADIFTIILVFLLKSFSTGIANISPSKGMVLPAVTTVSPDQMKESLKLEILPDGILIDQKPILKLSQFSVLRGPASAVDGETPESPVIEPLVQSLSREREKTKGNPEASKLLVLAHEKTPYSTLKAVMASAASAGYADLQLVVLGTR